MLTVPLLLRLFLLLRLLTPPPHLLQGGRIRGSASQEHTAARTKAEPWIAIQKTPPPPAAAAGLPASTERPGRRGGQQRWRQCCTCCSCSRTAGRPPSQRSRESSSRCSGGLLAGSQESAGGGGGATGGHTVERVWRMAQVVGVAAASGGHADDGAVAEAALSLLNVMGLLGVPHAAAAAS
ncbi:hypothetical protein CLOM_g2247 [Closterium sp. NIES-68]|nr:hypothetical protein CLOM_g2247 [Closterium sp. NIES-68]GJP58050.1 hypothetical protein CLOP_g20157 [Closterium sp. NIES-67]